MPAQPFDFAGRKVGPGEKCLVIAEAGVNHNGDMGLAKEMIDAAADAGADVVKFQSFRAEKLATRHTPQAEYSRHLAAGKLSHFDMLKSLELSESQHRDLMSYCEQKGVAFLSSPFDETMADLLDNLGVAGFKTPSGEITNLHYLAHIARKGRPMIVSTGMSSLGEVETALRTIQQAGDPPVVLLHCLSQYPAPPSEVNLRAMLTMAAAFGVPTGYSDHTEGVAVSVAAVALGACVIEKHYTLSRDLPGPDQKASLEPDELKRLVSEIRTVESCLGDGIKRMAPSEADTAKVARKSIVAARDLPAGAVLDGDSVTVKRPGTGLPPAFMEFVLGRKLRRAVRSDELIEMNSLE